MLQKRCSIAQRQRCYYFHNFCWHSVSEEKAQVLDLLCSIANSTSLAALEKNVAALKLSEPWKKSSQPRSYFDFLGKYMKVSD